ncbi:MAG TPA: hypothetical protein VIL85_21015 [Thermomicrobiales bacterium]
MSFEEARAEYDRLRQAYDQRQIAAEEYGRRVQGLQVRDAAGAYWAIDGNTGGWLRYDGTAWVPGQPPIPSTPPPSQFGGFNQPQQGQQQSGDFGQQPPQQGNFGQQPQGNFGTVGSGPPSFGSQTAGQPAAPARKSRRGLLIGCGVAALLLLICGTIGGILAARALGTTGLTDAAVATSLTSSNRPDQKGTEFAVNQQLYITYTVQNAKRGEVLELRIFRDNTRETLTGGENTFDKDATFYGSFTYKPTVAGSYRGEFYYKGESTPSKTVDFVVK